MCTRILSEVQSILGAQCVCAKGQFPSCSNCEVQHSYIPTKLQNHQSNVHVGPAEAPSTLIHSFLSLSQCSVSIRSALPGVQTVALEGVEGPPPPPPPAANLQNQSKVETSQLCVCVCVLCSMLSCVVCIGQCRPCIPLPRRPRPAGPPNVSPNPCLRSIKQCGLCDTEPRLLHAVVPIGGVLLNTPHNNEMGC